jgi:hypothetical protein
MHFGGLYGKNGREKSAFLAKRVKIKTTAIFVLAE